MPPSGRRRSRPTGTPRGSKALGGGKDFKEITPADVPAGQNHGHSSADVEVKLDKPAPTVYIRYMGDPGVNDLRT